MLYEHFGTDTSNIECLQNYSFLAIRVVLKRTYDLGACLGKSKNAEF